MSARPTLSVVIPAYNEVESILSTLTHVTSALSALRLDAEILVIDDGSRDGTGAIVEESRGRFPEVRLLVNDRNRGFGWTYRRGVNAAAGKYIVMVHGDDAWGADSLRGLFGHVGEADVVIGYTRGMWRSRTWTRTLISKGFTLLVNFITRRRLQYYNGPQIHRAEMLKDLRIESSGYGFQAEVLVLALARSRSFVEVPMDLKERERGASKAFCAGSVVDVIRTLMRLCSLQWSAASR